LTGLTVLLVLTACGGPEVAPWHTAKLTREFSADTAGSVEDFSAYLALEDDVFRQLDELVYAGSNTGPEYALVRYSAGSLADPGQNQPNWNRSFELAVENPRGAVLLLHGMSDSPYSLRALGLALQQQGYQVLGLRLPGHGTAPSGMVGIAWQDMAAAVTLSMQYLARQLGDKPIHIVGYSTGAALALDYSLRVEQDEAGPAATSLVLVSPAIGISPAAALASWKRRLGLIPGFGAMAWLQVEPEFDPYKYNSFATNAAEQVHRLTRSVSRRIAARDPAADPLPPILVMKSTVDATVSTTAVVDQLLLRLAPRRHELVLFDINRLAPASSLLVEDPAPLTRRLIDDRELPFALTLVTNTTPDTRAVSAFYKKPLARGNTRSEDLGMEWPPAVFSLSHVALPFPPNDPLYGNTPPRECNTLFLGQQAVQGERGILKISGDFLLRLRHNPFYDYLERRTLAWIDAAGAP
jgi:alpha-beta hydrolase superfamily lysophospholipase